MNFLQRKTNRSYETIIHIFRYAYFMLYVQCIITPIIHNIQLKIILNHYKCLVILHSEYYLIRIPEYQYSKVAHTNNVQCTTPHADCEIVSALISQENEKRHNFFVCDLENANVFYLNNNPLVSII